MTKQQRKQIDDLYIYSNNMADKEKEEKKKAKEREKRIKQRKNEQKDQFDFDTETVIGMTNKNNQKIKQKNQEKITKKQAKILKKKKKIKRIIKTIILLALIIGGFCFALISPIFNVTEINVTGNEQISSDTIISLSQLEIGQNLFRFNRIKVSNEIKTNAYIENVKIQRKIPNKIEITIEERKRDYNVEFLNGYAYINNQGYILEIAEQKLELPVIKGISTPQEQIVEGNRLDDEDLEKLETVIQIMNICKNYDLDTKISSIDITNKSNYIINMDEEKKTIQLGNDSNLRNKILYVPAILTENKEKEGTIYLNGDINGDFKPRFREKV
ncbi:pOTRA domain protein FtsQ-type [Clostridium sp. CAG:389]|nr:pOTRA domain protein FtsQ-type [Clostridium sp. CAG:389]